MRKPREAPESRDSTARRRATSALAETAETPNPAFAASHRLGDFELEGDAAVDAQNLAVGAGHDSVILSEAKDLMPVANGDEILRCAQDDRIFVARPASFQPKDRTPCVIGYLYRARR